MKSVAILLGALLVSSIFIQNAPAEGIHALRSAIGRAAMGVLDGRTPNPDHDLTKRTVMLFTEHPTDPKQSMGCTGTIVQGCIVTGGHCLRPGPTTFIYSGDKPDFSKPLASGSHKKIRGATGTGEDIAVLKPARPLPIEGFSTDALATEPLPKDAGSLDFIGYGFVGTREQETSDPKYPVKYIDYGAGRRRVGSCWFTGYGHLDFSSPQKTKASNATEGDMILVSRAQPDGLIKNLPTQGDSGGPLFFKNKIYGTAIGATGSRASWGEDVHARDMYAAAYTSMVKQRAWIINALEELGCGDHGSAAQRLRDLTAQHIYGFNGSYSSGRWDSLGYENKVLMEDAIRQVLGLGSEETIRVIPSINVVRHDSLDFFVADLIKRKAFQITVKDNGSASFKPYRFPMGQIEEVRTE
ncbi:MAG: trypsin-like serine protease [Deltaproteobacteria bacterium]|nr:trypsin-like serine protease [Deltaproteobacteria bacterium]